MPEPALSPTAGTYPIMLDVRGKICLIVGGGAVALRKLSGLFDAGASITVISPTILDEIQHYVSQGQVRWLQRDYEPGLLAEYRPFLVIAASDSPRSNDLVTEEAQQMAVIVNATHDQSLGSFSNMAVIRRPPLTIGLHTGGMSPALTRHLKDAINQVIGDEYVILSQWLGELRGPIRQQVSPQSRRQEFYQAVLHSDILLLLRQGETATAKQRLHDLINVWTSS